MEETFPQLLARLLDAKNAPKRKDFAASVGLAKSMVTDMCNGRRTPPPDKIDSMVQALGLTGSEEDSFRQAASASHVPEQLREYYQEELIRTRQEYDQLRRFLTAPIAPRPDEVKKYGAEAAQLIADLRKANTEALRALDKLKR